jgi:outer membrane lipoprotein-sorting protein
MSTALQSLTTRVLPLLLAALAVLAAAPARAIDQAETDKLVKQVDERQRNSGDYRAIAYIERKERNRNDTILEATIFRRDATDRLVILFSKPKEEAGKGYLRIDKNLFLYDPTVGKWERRTERERIGGTDSRRNDFDESRLAEEYRATWVATEKLGKFDVQHLELKAKEGVDVAFPVLQLWVDAATGNLLKQQEFALSGKLMRTSYYPKWNKLMSESKGSEVYFPGEIRIFDEVEKGNQTTVVFRSIDLAKLDDSIFTKAWLEARSR